jgi:hypothetical protein
LSAARHADIAGGLQADRVEAAIGRGHVQRVPVPDVHPCGKPGPGDQLTALPDLPTADVQSDDLAVDARGDPPRRLPDAAADIQHPHPRPDPGQLADQVGLGIQRLREALPAGKNPT